jgi:hypothetical protein
MRLCVTLPLSGSVVRAYSTRALPSCVLNTIAVFASCALLLELARQRRRQAVYFVQTNQTSVIVNRICAGANATALLHVHVLVRVRVLALVPLPLAVVV